MVYDTERNKIEMESRIEALHQSYRQFSRPQILRVSQVQIISNKRLRRKLSKADQKSTNMLSRIKQLKNNLRLMNQEINVFHDKTTDNTKNPFGTIPILTKLNAVKAKEINDLVLEYKEIERTIEGQHSRDRLFDSLNAELEQNELLIDVKSQNEKIPALQQSIDEIKQENNRLDIKIKSSVKEKGHLRALLHELMKSGDNLDDNLNYSVLNKCTEYSLLSNELTQSQLKCGQLGLA